MIAPLNHFLVGRPGVGKTALLLKIAQRLGAVRIGGFFTREIREARARVGFRVETFSGLSGVLAHVSHQQGPRVGKYRVDVATFEQVGVWGLENAVAEADVISVWPETSNAQVRIGVGEKCTVRMLGRRLNLLGDSASKPPTFVMRQRYCPQPDFQVIPIEKIALPTNSRDELPPILAGLQRVSTHPTLKAEIFALLEKKILAGKKATGRRGMDLWQILVLGVVRLGLDADWDRLEDLANHHMLIRQMLELPAVPWG